MKRKFSGDPAFRLELANIAADHAMQPITAEERAKLATPITRPFGKLHVHEEDCWGEPFERSILAPGKGYKGYIKVKVQTCRRGGAIREVKG